MNRRQFLECAAYLIGGASISPQVLGFSKEQQVYLATAPDYASQVADYLSADQRKIIAAMAETILPRTDTPGAIDAGVPRFIELMAAQWFNDQERAIFEAGLKKMQREIPARYGKPFYTLEADLQVDILEDMESEASGSSWYDFGNIRRESVSDAPFFCQVKELTVWGFFTSEVGSKEVLRYNPMPMRFDGDVPLEPGAPSWAGVIRG